MSQEPKPTTQTVEEGKPSKRSTKATVSQRVGEVLRLRLNGAEFYDLRQYASEQGWDVSERQLWRYVAQSDRLLAESIETNREKLLNRQIAMRQALFARAMAVSDYATARAVLKDLCDLLGLYPARKYEPPAGGIPYSIFVSGFDPELTLGKKLVSQQPAGENEEQEQEQVTTGEDSLDDDDSDDDTANDVM